MKSRGGDRFETRPHHCHRGQDGRRGGAEGRSPAGERSEADGGPQRQDPAARTGTAVLGSHPFPSTPNSRRCPLGSAAECHPGAGPLRVRNPLSRAVLPAAALPHARPRRLLVAPRRRGGRCAARPAARGAPRRVDPRNPPRPALRLEPGDPRRPCRLPAPHRVVASVRAASSRRRGALRDALRRLRRRPPVPALSDPGDRRGAGDREPRPGGGALPQGSARVRAAARSPRLPARPPLRARAPALPRGERDDAPRRG